MKLLIDVGNTRIKWAYADGEKLLFPGNSVHRGQAPAEAVRFVAELQQIPDAVAAVNVAGSAIEAALRFAIRERFGIDLQMIRTAVRFGNVLNGYSAHEQLGADRWAAMVGAWQIYRCAVCVVDAGTAVTIDLLAADGRHQGGIIVPGLTLLRSSLLRDTSDIDAFVSQSTGPPDRAAWLGTDTRSAVERGAILMLCAVIDRVADSMTRGGDAARIILTGGDASLLLPVLNFPVEQRPLLVLEGLRHLAAVSVDA
jgi:type III pantothenate kinase